jgi:hypothetical protein
MWLVHVAVQATERRRGDGGERSWNWRSRLEKSLPENGNKVTTKIFSHIRIQNSLAVCGSEDVAVYNTYKSCVHLDIQILYLDDKSEINYFTLDRGLMFSSSRSRLFILPGSLSVPGCLGTRRGYERRVQVRVRITRMLHPTP